MEVPKASEVKTESQEQTQKIDTEENNIIHSKNVTRYKGRYMKRQWEDNSPRPDEGESSGKKKCGRTVERIKKKKVAMLLGYCGVDYYGMQRNPGVRTIEEDLLKALRSAKYINEEEFANQQSMQFQRSSRTDKGVSAARQVVSLKLPLELKKEEINKFLPDCIRVFGIQRVTNRFNSKISCNARTYSYVVPTYVFEPLLVTPEERRRYRISPSKLEQIEKVLSIYKGTKPYHNFTEKKHFEDPSASRYMLGFNVDKVFVDSDMEFAVLLVKGQSFMLHQIRKMVGLTIALVRHHADSALSEAAFEKDKIIIPTAPGLGLVLDKVHYDRYDARYRTTHANLRWEDEEEEVQKFIHEYIYPVIVKGEVEDNSMGEWLDMKLSNHSYEPSEEDPLANEIGEEEAGADDATSDEDAADDENNDKVENSKKFRQDL
ncbi:pseudouridylate synthase 1 homolog isoform X2 [Pectinophora gossypiella]|nr:pseudouridylate synthase 1 homolog isoform X2 [Pectinophora gossypiella]XP_049885659.1 pseudouridylate synthase 1 homolog isoform X2 [Pectinophora gossypiella]XP_049885660.1 pseudouridylate synthase 1 homolog isoform X2 [Pectinophora gossypiella]